MKVLNILHRAIGGCSLHPPMAPVSIEITGGQKTKVAHVNRLHLRIQPELNETLQENPRNGHTVKEWEETTITNPRHLQRIRRPPDRFQPCTM